MTDRHDEDAPTGRGGGTPSRQVNWYEVYRFAERWASANGQHVVGNHALIPGTPQWCALPDDDARKLLALILGGVREALSNDIHQAAMAEASRQIANSENWSAVARRTRNGRGDSYIPRKAS